MTGSTLWSSEEDALLLSFPTSMTSAEVAQRINTAFPAGRRRTSKACRNRRILLLNPNRRRRHFAHEITQPSDIEMLALHRRWTA